jgi:DNA-binding NtrC family response regulator
MRLPGEIRRTQAARKVTHTCSILVVDDDENLRRTLVQILRKEGYETDWAENAERSLQLLHDKPYTLVILDHKLPDMNGLTLLTAVRKMYPKLRVLILTGAGTDELRQEAANRGAWSYLRKPVDPETILDLIDSICA